MSYPQKGLQIDCTAQDGIESFLVHLQNMEETITNAFPGQVIFEKKSLIGGFSEDDVLNILPPPWWRHEDENEVILFYEFGAIEWQVEIPSTGLHAILICPPLLANEEQRRNYQVTRPWTFAESADTIQ